MRPWVWALALLAGCAAYIPEPDPAMAGGDGAVLAELRAGRRIYVSKCGGCHSLIPVDRYDDAKWSQEVAEMIRLKKVRLAQDEQASLVRYLSTANKH